MRNRTVRRIERWRLIPSLTNNLYRCYNLHDALEAAHALTNGRKYQFAAVLSHDIQPNVPSADSYSDRVEPTTSLSCSYCMDSPAVVMCAFCGCKVSTRPRHMLCMRIVPMIELFKHIVLHAIGVL